MIIEAERVFKGSDRPVRSGKVTNAVYKTDDYSIFKLSKFNRNVIMSNKMLEQAKQGFVSPIIVNEEMIVIDGQNRLLHAKEVGVPVEYIIKEGLTEEDITRMNINQRPWSLKNFIEAFANQGFSEYVKLVDLINEKYSNVTNIIRFSLDYPTAAETPTKIVTEGKFKFHNYDKTLEFLKYYQRFRERTKTPKRSRVESALYVLFRIEGFDKERAINKVIQKGIDEDIKVKDPKHTEALKMLLDCYNDQLKSSSPKFFSYHITSHGTIIIDRDKKTWTRKSYEQESDEQIYE